MVKIKVNRETCIGCGACVSICPKSFEMHEGKAKEKVSEVKKVTCEKEAAESCPVNAITIK
jgi:ferredoxin